MQTQMEQILQSEAQATKSQLLSAIIIDPNTGQIKAMANYPTYNPADYESVTDPSVFQNAPLLMQLKPGSSMKTLTTPAALNLGVIQPDTSFYDPAKWVVDGFTITDIEQDGGSSGTKYRQHSILVTEHRCGLDADANGRRTNRSKGN